MGRCLWPGSHDVGLRPRTHCMVIPFPANAPCSLGPNSNPTPRCIWGIITIETLSSCLWCRKLFQTKKEHKLTAKSQEILRQDSVPPLNSEWCIWVYLTLRLVIQTHARLTLSRLCSESYGVFLLLRKEHKSQRRSKGIQSERYG